MYAFKARSKGKIFPILLLFKYKLVIFPLMVISIKKWAKYLWYS